ncbi:MAG: molybdenum ABC transporter ATP-binding protein [Hyphomicrobiaceae bacterium]|nr:molybdenum ABC transporter ATP-binding protein [Hyphomicrobiaceae bacterium]
MTLDVALEHRFGNFEIAISFAAPHGITALFGRSGAGKTTVINAIAGLVKPRSGRIVADAATLFDTSRGIDLPTHARRIGYVFQESRLFPHLSVRQNLLYGRWFAPRAVRQQRLDDVVDLLDVARLLDRQPGELSGGEKQRVAIGRALLASPRLLLMDEPLASLDEARKSEILPYLERLRDEVRLPIVYVSHSISEVARLATTIVAISDGRVARVGPTAEVMSDPDTFPLMGRQEAGAILPAKVLRHDLHDGLTELVTSGGRLLTPRVEAPPGTDVRVRIRARDVILALAEPQGLSALNILPVTIRKLGSQDGVVVDVAITCGTDDLLVRVTRRSVERLGLAAGKSCFAVFKSVAVARRDISTVDAKPD